uniref:NAC domain-containing protein n=1 Tax=Oryza meridionalis TaxID=40149 RepID=A0A0E0ES46_9ORYZ
MSARGGVTMGGDRASSSSSSTAMISRLLPPGFRFRPTDGELVAHYLARKAADAGFTSAAIRDADLYRAEPWDLLPPPRCDAAAAEEEEEERCGYFFCTRSFRWPSGTRTNRATAAGYWKSTGKDKAVLHGGGCPVGVKKTLVFYRGRAPRGEKTSWVMHEYRLLHGGAAATASSSPTPTTTLAGVARSEWVICRVFVRKTPNGNNDRGTTERHLPSNDNHLRSSPAPANSVDGAGHASCSFFSGAHESMAPSDHFNIGDDVILHGHDEEELLMMTNCSSFDLPELLDYESFSLDL